MIDTRRLTAGAMTSRGMFSLDNPRLREAMVERERIRKEREEKSAKTKQKIPKRFAMVLKRCEKMGP